ncbi:MAG: serine/threonine protein kinase, partial [Lentisphaeria bacterium]|nr:serine/threonine protein kinase [Lentisphaeria bacterium]
MKWLKKKDKTLKPGMVFEKYTVEKELGHGGMGMVYLVRHNMLDSHFAMKVLDSDVAAKNKHFVDRFIREAKLACKIRHPNLITVHDAGMNPGTGLYYIVMDYVPGGNVRDLLKAKGHIPPDRALEIIRQMAGALCAAYAHHMVHRDIKPDNIMFAVDGSAKLADLGIAKSTDEHDPTLTMAATVFGTPAYMSPEQARDSSQVDIRADIYSLGIVFYEMLSGQRPFNGPTPMSILSQVMGPQSVPDIRAVAPDVPRELASLIAEMTEKDLGRRIANPDILLKKLNAIRLPVQRNAAPRSAAAARTVPPATGTSDVTIPTMASVPDVTIPTIAPSETTAMPDVTLATVPPPETVSAPDVTLATVPPPET